MRRTVVGVASMAMLVASGAATALSSGAGAQAGALVTVSPDAGVVDGQIVQVTASEVVDNGGVVVGITVFGPAVYQCAAEVSVLDIGTIVAPLDYLASFDAYCSRLTPTVPVPGGVLDEQVTVRQPLVTGGNGPVGSVSEIVDCEVTDCVILVMAISGDLFDGEPEVIDYFETAPIAVSPGVVAGEVVADPEGDVGSTTWQVPVTLSRPFAVPVTVDYQTADDTATAGTDYAAASGTVTFPAGETAQSVPIEVLGDTEGEADETGLVVFSDPSESSLVVPGPGRFLIVDDDPVVAAGEVTADPEGDSGTTIWELPVTLSRPSFAAVTVDYQTVDDTATAGRDYVAASGTVTFPAGETAQTVPIEVIGDTEVESATEWLDVEFSNPSTNASLAPGPGRVGIVDDEGPIIYVDVAATGAEEGSSWADAFTDLQHALAVATAGDEIRVAEGRYTPDASDPTVSFEIIGGPIVGGQFPDPIAVAGGYPTGGGPEPDPSRHETVLSGDLLGDDQPGGVNRADNSERVVTASGRGSVVLSGLTVTDGNGERGPACPFRSTGGGVVVADGRPIIRDSKIVGNVGVGLHVEREHSASLEDVVVADNDGCGIVVGEDSGFGARHLTVTGNAGTGIHTGDVTMPLVDSVIADNTGAAGGIFTNDGGRLILVNSVVARNRATGNGGGINVGGLASGLIVNSLLIDNHSDGAGGGLYLEDEFTSASVVNSVIADNSASVGGGITMDPDARHGPVHAFVENSVIWGNTPGPAIVVGGPDADQEATVDHSIVEGWAGPGSGNIDQDPLFVGAGDYRLQSGSPAIDAGDDARVPADQYDVDADGDVAEPTPDLDLQDRIQDAAVDIGAHETTPLPVVIPGAATVTEGNDGTIIAAVPLTLSEPSEVPVTADWVIVDYTATAPGDHVSGAGTVTFAPGETETTLPVTVNGDLLHEADEFALVWIRNPTNATIGGFYGLGFVTIVDDDPEPVAIPWIGFATEGDTGVSDLDVPVYLSAPSGLPVTLDWATHDLTAGSPGDYQAASGSITVDPGDTNGVATITVNGDTKRELPEAFIVSFDNPTGAILGGLFGFGAGIIIDDDWFY